MVRPFAVGSPLKRPTCWPCPIRRRRSLILSARCRRLSRDLHHRRNGHEGSLQSRSARHCPARRKISAIAPAWRTRRCSDRKRSSSSSTTCSTITNPTARFTRSIREEAVWNTGRDEMPNLGYKIRHKEGYFPVAPTDTQQDIRTEMCLIMEQLGHSGGAPASRSRHGGPGGN